MDDAGAKLVAAGGSYAVEVVGREVVCDFTPPHGRARARVYTSIAAGDRSARECGEDAVRVVVGTDVESGWRNVTQPRRVFRTAPAAGDRVAAFLDRLLGVLRAAYAEAARCPACPDCGRAMAVREAGGRKFRGCVGYPTCRVTKNLEAVR